VTDERDPTQTSPDADADTPGQDDAETTPPAADAPAATPVDTAEGRAARLAEIDRELVQADADLAAVNRRLTSLRAERDRLQRMGLGPAVSQAEALKRMVESDQSQRIARANAAALVTGILGGKLPTVRTPAEQAAMQKKRPVSVPGQPPKQ
jgi:hypothetical protein